MNGFFNVLKPVGLTSTNVVAKVRRFLILNGEDKNVKVGHMGTLDPGGTGVLPIAVGKATRLFNYLLDDKEKRYTAEFVFGTTTDTLDSYGTVVGTGSVPTKEKILSCISQIIGTYEQIPPIYSAKSIDGVRAYNLARKGVAVDLKGAKITVFSAEVIKIDDGRVTLDIRCSAGTYIRSVCRDLANCLGTVGYMSFIIRTENGAFKIEDSVTLDELELHKLLPVDFALQLPRVADLSDSELKYMKNGLPRFSNRANGKYYVVENGDVIGIAEQKDGLLGFVTRL